MGFPSEDKFEEIEPNLTFRHLPNYSNEIVANFYVEALYRLYPFTPVLNFAGAPLYSYNIFR